MDTQIPQAPVAPKGGSIAVPIAIVIAGALIAGAVIFTNKNQVNPNNVINAANTVIEVAPVTENDHIFGNPNADIYVIEYSDIECPFCKRFQDTMNRIMQEYGKDGKVAWVYRHYPIEQLHSNAPKESEATECANEIGGKSKFWDYLNKLYSVTPSNNGLDLNQLPIIAEGLGINKAEFTKCLSSGKYKKFIDESVIAAQKAGASGTPYSVILDKKTGEKFPIDGALPYETIKTVLDGVIKGK